MSLSATNHGINEVIHVASGTIAYTTSAVDEIIVLFVNSQPNSSVAPVPVSSVTDTNGLTWTKRKALSYLNTAPNTYDDLEIWWAHAPTATSGTITVNMTGTIDGLAMIYAAISGCTNFSNPWNSNVSLPATTTNPGGAATPSLSVNTTGDAYVFGMWGGPHNNGQIAGTGFTMLEGALFNNPTLWVNDYVEGAYFSTSQTGLAVAMGNSVDSWGFIVDALSTAGTVSAHPYAQGRVIT